MKRVGNYGVDEAIPLWRQTESRAWRTQVVSQGEEAPGILPGYLGPFSGAGSSPKRKNRTKAGGQGPGTRVRTRLIAASTASGYASPSTTQSGLSDDALCRNGAVEIRPGKASAAHGGICYEDLITQGV
jgi:hypothetical protein